MRVREEIDQHTAPLAPRAADWNYENGSSWHQQVTFTAAPEFPLAALPVLRYALMTEFSRGHGSTGISFSCLIICHLMTLSSRRYCRNTAFSAVTAQPVYFPANARGGGERSKVNLITKRMWSTSTVRASAACAVLNVRVVK